ncbi:MAG: hypothetical protein KIH10_12715 [Candidatus Freyarchaeota archaeon]|nr:hypothetical protein [Candidatus Jordarchaeia archaeon]MBS7279574.1 hypothetical protein [Candidatus Jordarchaeia archaeon]
MAEFEEVIKRIKDYENKNKCFNTEVTSCLYFEPRETKVVLISESPLPSSEAGDNFIEGFFVGL